MELTLTHKEEFIQKLHKTANMLGLTIIDSKRLGSLILIRQSHSRRRAV